MAERRMFAKAIVTSDAFIDMPHSARDLYFTLGIFADDDGFVNNPRGIIRQIGASKEDLKVLLDNKFILGFDSGVVVIKHWKINNYIRNDRYKETKYLRERAMLITDEKGAYTRRGQDGYRTDTKGIPMVSNRDTQVSIGKDRLGKVNIEAARARVEDSGFTGGRPAKSGGNPPLPPPTEAEADAEERSRRQMQNTEADADVFGFSYVPTLEELIDYAERMNLTSVNVYRFYEYYSANGFMTVRGPLDWRLKLREWDEEDKKTRGTQARGSAKSKRNPSFDVDEFFERAVHRSYEAMPDTADVDEMK